VIDTIIIDFETISKDLQQVIETGDAESLTENVLGDNEGLQQFNSHEPALVQANGIRPKRIKKRLGHLQDFVVG